MDFAEYNSNKNKKYNIRINIVCIKFLLLLITILPLFFCTACSPTSAAPTIIITYPSNGSTVIQDEAIYGTSEDIPDGYQIWILGYSYDGIYYPRPESETIQENGDWSIPIEIGSYDSTGFKYDIIAVLADTEANTTLNNYVIDCIQNNNWPGVENIPVGAVEYDRITVTRSTQNPEIKITYPSNESTVIQDETVNGTSENIPDGYQIWILGYSYDGTYYPRPESETIQENEEWSIPIEIGSDGDVGVKYDIIAMLADAEANETFSNYATSYTQNKQWPDIKNIPVGAKEYNRITVTRIGSLLPVADFSTSVTGGYAPLSVTFTDLSQNATLRSWDVNSDGTEDSTEASFTYEYASAGTYTAKLTAINAIGTDEKTATISVERRSSGGSSGGGGGGGGSPEPAKNVQVKELAQVFITNGKAVQFDFTKNATCVVNVGFDSKKTAGKTTTIVEQLKNKSTLVSGVPKGEVYKYFNVWVGNSGFATSDNIDNPNICFKIEKSWLQDKNIDKDSIALNRYSNKTWEQLPVSLLKEDSKYQYFTADVPGYSFFAIIGRIITEENLNETQQGSKTQDLGEDNTEIINKQQSSRNNSSIKDINSKFVRGYIRSIILIIGILIIISLIFFVLKRKN